MKKLQKLFLNRRGISIYIAIIFTTALMLISVTLARIVIVETQNEERYEKKAQVDYMAESVESAATWLAKYALPEGGGQSDISPQTLASVEQLLLHSAEKDGADISHCADIDSNPNNGLQPCFEFQIRKRGAPADAAANFGSGTLRFKNKDLYSVPVKGTGSVTDQCVDADNPDDPCNWNKLAFGDSIEIPLYYTDGAGVTHVPDFRAQNQNAAFYLRMRTPCEVESPNANKDALEAVQRDYPNVNSVAEALNILQIAPTVKGIQYPRNCDPDERIELYPAVGSADYLSFEKDPVIVQWLIKAEGVEELIALEGKTNLNKRPGLNAPNLENFNINSQLTGGRLNMANNDNGANYLNNFINLAIDNRGKFILNSDALPPLILTHIFNNRLKKPSLKLNAVRKLRKDRNRNEAAGYLEYQLLVSEPVADPETKIQVTVRLYGMSASGEISLKAKKGAEDFVLGNL